MKIQCLIIDDEQLARDMLEAYVARIPELVVIAKCKSAAIAQPYLIKNKIDLLFLDIQMPGMTGLEFLRQLEEPPKVIFTTAYSDYALESYELEVVDYLLKPIGFDRFKKAVDKATLLFSIKQKAQDFDNSKKIEDQFIIIKEGYNHHKIFLKDILYVSAMREYARYYTSEGKFMELTTMFSVAKKLPQSHFIRIHRSYIVAKSVVKGHEQNKLLLKNGVGLPIGKTFKQIIMKDFFPNV